MVTHQAVLDALATRRSAIDAMFNPSVVAIVGASDDQTKYGNWIAKQALQGRPRVHLVNPKRATVLGHRTVSTLAEIGEQVDSVVVAVPVTAFERAVEEALDAGVRSIVAITAGLSESGADGARMEERVVRRVRESGAVLLGPNCLGMSDTSSGVRLTSNLFLPGRISLVSQSGNLSLEIAKLLAENGQGISRFVSLGNQADLDVADIVDSFIDHDDTDAIAVYCEDFRDGRRFCEVALRAYEAGKPVVLMTVGRGAGSARGAESHTGSMVSSDIVVQAACATAGAELVRTPSELATLLHGLAQGSHLRGKRMAVFADGGGQASVASDVVESAGLFVDEFSASLQDELVNSLSPNAGTRNPIDGAGAGEQDITSFARVTGVLVDSDEVDGVLLTGYFGGYGEYDHEMGKDEVRVAAQIVDIAQCTEKPVVVQTMCADSAAAQLLRAGGVPTFRRIEDAGWFLSRLDRRTNVNQRLGLPRALDPLPRIQETGYFAARRELAQAGLPFLAAREVETEDELVRAASDLGYPLVLKALGSEHKSDAGGVRLGIKDQFALIEAWNDMRSRLASPTFSVEVMAHVPGAVEIIIGARRDPKFGSVVLVGLGGTMTELLRDIRCALGPVDHQSARAMLTSLRGSALLTGFRGSTPVDLDSAADVICRLSEFAAAHPEVAEVECNPVAISVSGAVCLDARMLLH